MNIKSVAGRKPCNRNVVKSGSNAINLPEYDGKTTHGVLVLEDGTQIGFTSGNGDPRYTNPELFIAVSHKQCFSA